MRRILLTGLVTGLAFGVLAGQALAGDLPSTKGAPIFEPPLAVSWTGFYTGDQLGMLWGRGQWNFPTAAVSTTTNAFGALAGEHAGYRQQFGTWVLGVQGQADMVAAEGNSTIGPTSFQMRQSWLYSVDAQLGYAFADRWLAYAIGGGAFTTIKSQIFNGAILAAYKSNASGFDLGAGLEYAISDHWSAFAEYRFYDFGKANYAAFNPAGAGIIYPVHSIALTDNVARLGASYRFTLDGLFGAPVAAKY